MYKKGRVGQKKSPVDLADPANFRYVSNELKKHISERDGGQCVRCGSTHALDFEHAVPFSVGGLTSKENLQLMCRDCNSEKGVRIWWGPTLIQLAITKKTLKYIEALYRQQRYGNP